MTKYAVCLSFAGENRPYVDEVARHLGDLGIETFYDLNEQADLWGKDLTEHLDKIYRQDSRFCVMFVSQHYVRKMWTIHERRSALARGLENHETEYVLPVRFDDTPVPGLRPSVGYLDLRHLTPRQLAEMIAKKVGTPVPAPAAGWEYELFAHTLRTGLQGLGSKRHDHDLGFAPGVRTFHTEKDAFDHFLGSTQEFDRVINSIADVLAPDKQEWAFGAPGQPGNADKIRHLATRFTSLYEQLLDWAAGLRGTVTPESHRALYAATAKLVDGPLRQIEEFAQQFATSVAQRPEQPVELRLTIDYSLAEVEAELAKVQTT